MTPTIATIHSALALRSRPHAPTVHVRAIRDRDPFQPEAPAKQFERPSGDDGVAVDDDAVVRLGARAHGKGLDFPVGGRRAEAFGFGPEHANQPSQHRPHRPNQDTEAGPRGLVPPRGLLRDLITIRVTNVPLRVQQHRLAHHDLVAVHFVFSFDVAPPKNSAPHKAVHELGRHEPHGRHDAAGELVVQPKAGTDGGKRGKMSVSFGTRT